MKNLFKILTKKVVLAILAILVIGTPLLYLTVLNQKETKAALASGPRRYDDNWAYRQAVNVTSKSGEINYV